MARRHRRRTSLRKPASAFAPGVGGSGRTRSWEALSTAVTPEPIATQFPTLAFAAAGFDIRFVTLIPGNVLRGTVTVQRIVGHVACYFDVDQIAAAGGQDSAFIAAQIQLVPLANAAIQDASVLSPINSADLESNRILWRRLYTPLLQPTGGLLSVNRLMGQHQPTEVDIKVQRRFDRALFALIFVVASTSSDVTLSRIGLDLRGLFLAADGI